MFTFSWRSIFYVEPIQYTLGVFVAIAALVLVFAIRTRGTEERVQFLAHVGKWAGYLVSVGLAGLYVARITVQFWGTTVPVRLTYSRFWPDLPAEVSVTSGTATVEPNNSGFADALLSVSDLSLVARVLQASATLAEGVVAVTLTLVIAQLSSSLLGNRTFAGSRWKLLARASYTIFAAGLMWIIVDIPAQIAVAQEVNYRFVDFDTDLWTCVMDGSHACGIVYWDLSSFAPTWPLLAAIVMMVGSLILRRGHELEAENEGLI